MREFSDIYELFCDSKMSEKNWKKTNDKYTNVLDCDAFFNWLLSMFCFAPGDALAPTLAKNPQRKLLQRLFFLFLCFFRLAFTLLRVAVFFFSR